MSPPPDELTPPLAAPRFGLRTLFLLVAVLCAFFAFAAAFGMLAGAGLLLVALSILGHVAGNAIGTRLRAANPRKGSGALEETPRLPPRAAVAAEQFAPPTRLSRRDPLGWFVPTLTILGAVLAGLVGGTLLAWLSWKQATAASVGVGYFAAGVLGAIWSFLVAGCAKGLFQAWREAAGETRRP